MSAAFMVLPSKNFSAIQVIRIPADYEQHEAYRKVTGLIAEVEESIPDYGWEDIADVLENHGFEPANFIIGPTLD